MIEYKLKYYSDKDTAYAGNLTSEEYETIVAQRLYIYFFLHVEELYEIFKINVFEFWKYLLEITETHRLNTIYDYDELLQPRLIINQRLANILTSFKSYEDLFNKSVSDQFKNDKVIKEHLKSYFKGVYAEYFEYRFFYKVRNYMQHYDLPIDGVEFASQMINLPFTDIAFTTNPYLTKGKLLKYDSWGTVKEEIENLPDKILLKSFLNGFLLSINVLHNNIRTFLLPKYNDARNNIEKYIKECSEHYIERFANSPEWIRVYIVKHEVGKTPYEKWLPDDEFERIDRMLKKNSLSVNVRSSFSTMQQLKDAL
ncbi:MAG: hypothetical protein C0412_02115 [Flavobacterium sp.]|nr:hypothetical protein [Flavobacterium sp.]